MASCDFCHSKSTSGLASCVCGQVSYCNKHCQSQDWKSHKPSCPPFRVREVAGKGRGLFATRKIKAGEIILEELPFLTCRLGSHLSPLDMSASEIAKVLCLHDPLENLKSLDSNKIEELINKNHWLSMDWNWKQEGKTNFVEKLYRICRGNGLPICEDFSLYDSDECGIYEKISLINHSCIPNVVWSWVKGDFRRKQVRAMKTIQKGEEILACYDFSREFCYGSRDFRRQKILDGFGFLCQCSECSLDGKALEENERKRLEIRERELTQLVRLPTERALKACQESLELVKELDIRFMFVAQLMNTSLLASEATRFGISGPDANMLRLEALEYAKMFGDVHVNLYNKMYNMILKANLNFVV